MTLVQIHDLRTPRLSSYPYSFSVYSVNYPIFFFGVVSADVLINITIKDYEKVRHRFVLWFPVSLYSPNKSQSLSLFLSFFSIVNLNPLYTSQRCSFLTPLQKNRFLCRVSNVNPFYKIESVSDIVTQSQNRRISLVVPLKNCGLRIRCGTWC